MPEFSVPIQITLFSMSSFAWKQNVRGYHTIVRFSLMEIHSSKHMLRLKAWITSRLLCVLLARLHKTTTTKKKKKQQVSVQTERYSIVALMEH